MGEPVQGSDQHSSRLDDDIARDPGAVEEVADAGLWDEPGHDRVIGPDSDPDRADLRSEIGRYVSLAKFPTDAQTLASVAERNGAPDTVLGELGALEPVTRFTNPSDLWVALGLSTGDRF